MKTKSARRAADKLLGRTSCLGCNYLLKHDRGYSNYTVEDAEISCVLHKNPLLPETEPMDWDWDMGKHTDNWPATNQGRCECYEEIGHQPYWWCDVEQEEASHLPRHIQVFILDED